MLFWIHIIVWSAVFVIFNNGFYTQLFRCTCPSGFHGERCEVNIDDCVRHRCQNNATCVDGVQTYSCKCTPGYMGKILLNVQKWVRIQSQYVFILILEKSKLICYLNTRYLHIYKSSTSLIIIVYWQGLFQYNVAFRFRT